MTTAATHLNSHALLRVRALPLRETKARPRFYKPEAAAAESAPPQCPAVRLMEAGESRQAPRTAAATAFKSQPASRAAQKAKRTDTIEFRLIFSAAFVVFLLTAALERTLPHKWGASQKSVVEQAREAASISAGYAFMG